MSSSRCWDLFKGSSISEILQRRFWGLGVGMHRTALLGLEEMSQEMSLKRLMVVGF